MKVEKVRFLLVTYRLWKGWKSPKLWTIQDKNRKLLKNYTASFFRDFLVIFDADIRSFLALTISNLLISGWPQIDKKLASSTFIFQFDLSLSILATTIRAFIPISIVAWNNLKTTVCGLFHFSVPENHPQSLGRISDLHVWLHPSEVLAAQEVENQSPWKPRRRKWYWHKCQNRIEI